ncbi:MFS transporter [Flaviflexus salsibiostraticola]|uniref:MFS transporter n=2 Tax=Flaviflexus salsibiostraticola TaxID=1282737 RepID=A0A3S8Z782_9ACTO|nr:MFS transporter [Flaviflexus salsibiostraticola]AZN29284.1 MFS transporter [Flaviflexus salsibiostraticola]
MINLREEVRANDLTKGHRIFLLILVSMGSSIIYAPAYLKNVIYDPLMEALNASNEQIGSLITAYAITATICYLPSGIIADKIRMRTLAWVGFSSTAVLTFMYGLLPSMVMLHLIFVGMGVTTILIWWGIRFKLVRLISEEEDYSRNIGLSYGVYGAAGLIMGVVQLAIISWMATNMDMAVRSLIWILAGIILVLGVLSFLFIPKFEGEIANTKENGFSLSELRDALKSPVVWIAAATMFCVYFYYTGVSYTTPYLTSVLGASVGIATFVSVIRTYGVTLLSGPAFGFMAKAVNSPSKIIAAGSLVTAISIVVLTFLPSNQAATIIAALIIVLLGFIANGVFGIVSSQLTEGKVPLTIFGTATGLLSVVGFLPDTFSSKWFGAMIDEKGNDAYPQIFGILAGVAVLAMVCAIALILYVRRTNARTADAVIEAEIAAQGTIPPAAAEAALAETAVEVEPTRG